MKKQLTIFAALLVIFLLFVTTMAFASSDIQATQSISIGSGSVTDAVSDLAGLWLRDHWQWIALFASELLAFVPSKFNGIAHAILSIGSDLFGKKKNL